MIVALVEHVCADLKWIANRALQYPRLAIVLAALAASIAGIGNDFVYDDIPLVRDNARVSSGAVQDVWLKPYWPPPFVEQLYRPLTVQLLSAEHAIGAGQPAVFRVGSYLLYALSAVLFYRLALLLVRERVALASAILFAVHPVHVEAVALAVGQAELVVAILCLLCAERYVTWRRRGLLHGGDWLLLGGLYTAAALFKENAFVMPALLVGAELTVIRSTNRRERSLSVAIGIVMFGAIAAALTVVRSRVLPHGAFEVVSAKTIAGLSAWDRLIAMTSIIPSWILRLVFPLHLQVDYVPPPPGSIWTPAVITGALIVLLAVSLVIVSWRRLPQIAFALGWCLIAFLPISNIIPTGVVLAERTLFLPSVGALLLVAAVAQRIYETEMRLAVHRWICAAFTLAVVGGVIRSTSRELVWNSAHLKVVGPSATTAISPASTTATRRRISALR